MRRFVTRVSQISLVTALVCAAFVFSGQKTTAAPGINRQVNYQGKLLTASGVPVADGTYSVKFSIYDAVSSGNRLWTAAGTTSTPSAVSVSVSGGLFSVLLGDTDAGQNAFDFDWFQQGLYLGVTVASDSEMTPRKRLSAVPYAFVAETLQGQYASSSVTSTGGVLFRLQQQSSDAATADRTALYISTSGTSDAFDYLIKGFNGSDVFSVNRQGHTTTTGNLDVAGDATLGNASADAIILNGRINSDAVPFSNNTYDLGSSLLSWTEIFASSTVHAGGVTSTGNINPFASNTYDLGSTSLIWKNLFVGSVSATGNIAPTADGTYDLGASGKDWKTIYGETVSANVQVVTPQVVRGGSAEGMFMSSGNLLFKVGGSNQYNFNTTDISPTSSNMASLGLATASWKDIYASGTAVIGTDVTVGGTSVCLADGTNCPASGGTTFWSYDSSQDFVRPNTNTTGVLIGGSTIDSAPFYFDITTTSSRLYIGGYGSSTDVVIGNTTSSGLNSLFTLSGNDLHVEGNIGSVSSVYTNGAFIAGTGSTYFGDGFITKTNGDLTVTSTGNIVMVGGDGNNNVVVGTSTGAEKLTVVGNIGNTLDAGLSYTTVGSASDIGIFPLSIVVQGRYTYIVARGESASESENELVVVDITDVTSPSTTGRVYVAGGTGSGGGPFDLAVQGKYAYVASGISGTTNGILNVVDVANPASPAVISTTTVDATYGSLNSKGIGPEIEVQGRYAYVAPGCAGSVCQVSIVDIGDPFAPTVVKELTVASGGFDYIRDLQIRGKYLYVILNWQNDTGKGLYIYDVSDPKNPSLVSSTLIGTTAIRPWSINVQGGYAYIVDAEIDKFYVFDVTNPSSPKERGSISLGGLLSTEIAINGRYAYVSVTSGAFNGSTVSVIDIASSTAPTVVGTINQKSLNAFVSGRYLHMVDRANAQYHIVDIKGIETNGLAAASAEFGSLQVRGRAFIDRELDIAGSLGVGVGGIYSDGSLVVSGSSATSTFIGAVSTTRLLVNSTQVCLADGTNCPVSSRDLSLHWTYNSQGFIRPTTSSNDVVIGGTNSSTAPFAFKLAGADTFTVGQDTNIGGATANIAVGTSSYSNANFYSLFSFNGADILLDGGTTNDATLAVASSVFTNAAFYAGATSPTFIENGLISDIGGGLTIEASGGADLKLQTAAGGGITIDPDTTGGDTLILGGSSADQIDYTGRAGTSFLPITDNLYSLGSASLRWDAQLETATSVHIDSVDTATSVGRGAGQFLKAWATGTGSAGVIGVASGTGIGLSDIPAMNTMDFSGGIGEPISSAGGYFVNGINESVGWHPALLAIDKSSSTRGGAIFASRECGGDPNVDILLIESDVLSGAGQRRMSVRCDGQIFADNGTVGTPGDYAEYFYTTDTSIMVGEVVAMTGDSYTSSVKRTVDADRNSVLGVVSGRPLVLGNAGEDGAHENNPNYKAVGLLGQIPTKASNANGNIMAGDLVMAADGGRVVKASGIGMVVGRAMENLNAMTGMIYVYVSPHWSGGDTLFADIGSNDAVIGRAQIATASTTSVDSFGFTFRGSAWNAASSSAVDMNFTLQTDVIHASSSLFTVRGNQNQNLLTISDIGDVGVTGDLSVGRRLYLGSRATGVASTSTYIFVDDTSSTSSQYIATNADGWATNETYDYAERFFSTDDLRPGDLVVADVDGTDSVRRSATKNDAILGIVSTRPGFITGARATGTHPIALAGRVPTRVLTTNGPIRAGDELAPSDTPGVAVKAVGAGPTVGVALESYDAPTEGRISVFVQPGWRGGEVVQEKSETSSAVTFIEYTDPGVSPRSGLAIIFAGQKEVNVSFPTLNTYPLVTVTPYGITNGGWGLRNVNDHGFVMVLESEQTADLTVAWKAEPSQEGSKVWYSDGTSAIYDPTSGEAVPKEALPEKSEAASEEEAVDAPVAATSTAPVPEGTPTDIVETAPDAPDEFVATEDPPIAEEPSTTDVVAADSQASASSTAS